MFDCRVGEGGRKKGSEERGDGRGARGNVNEMRMLFEMFRVVSEGRCANSGGRVSNLQNDRSKWVNTPRSENSVGKEWSGFLWN